MSPKIIDIVAPPPPEFIGFELHANIEGLKAPIKIEGYEPELLGRTIEQAETGAFAQLIECHRYGASLAVPIVQAIYKKDKQTALHLSSLAQSMSAKCTADFIYTIFNIAERNNIDNDNECELDLCSYPYIGSDIDMLYRYQPLRDISLIPYSGGKLHPLALLDENYKVIKVHGFGVVPFLGPPMTKNHNRIADVEFFINPKAFRRFSAKVGLNPLFEHSLPSANFYVIADGQIIAESGAVAPKLPYVKMDAALKNDAHFFTLRMEYINPPDTEEIKNLNCKHLEWVSHGVWADPVLK